jgi:hypothetical protein
VKLTKPEARYLVQSAREDLRWARRYERSIKLNLLGHPALVDTRRAHDCAASVDTRRRDAAERMALAMRLEAT